MTTSSSTESVHAIAVRDLCKTFKAGKANQVLALQGIDLDVAQGAVYSILGPNGAGKTTLLRILTTVMSADSGSASICGYDIASQPGAVRQLIGIVSQENNFDKYLTIWHNLAVHAELHGMTREEYTPRIEELLRMVGLFERRHDHAENFSGGMQRRVALIRALIHRPQVLFLDEPTTGLDPKARREIWHIIEQLKHSTTVILTTHYMEEADVLSDGLMMMNHGRVVMTGTPQELKKKISPENTFDMRFHSNKATHYATHFKDKAVGEPDVLTKCHLRLKLSNGKTLQDVLAIVDWQDIVAVSETEVDLETVYLALSEGQPLEAMS